MDFDEQKRRYLSALTKEDYSDKSKKGSVDIQILPLLSSINSHPDYYTTSSCAGRITLFVEPTSQKKYDGQWLLSTHDELQQTELRDALSLISTTKEMVLFEQEAGILHICCRTLQAAQELVDAAKFCGLKRSGIMSTRRRIMVELLSTERVEAPIAKEGILLVSEDYLEHLRIFANLRLMRTRKKLDAFRKTLYDFGKRTSSSAGARENNL